MIVIEAFYHCESCPRCEMIQLHNNVEPGASVRVPEALPEGWTGGHDQLLRCEHCTGKRGH